jgi:hypothetical protein
MRIKVDNLAVCIDCLHMIVNGECSRCADEACSTWAGQLRTWGAEDVTHLVAGGEDDLGFMWDRCDGCGEGTGGERFSAAILGA